MTTYYGALTVLPGSMRFRRKLAAATELCVAWPTELSRLIRMKTGDAHLWKNRDASLSTVACLLLMLYRKLPLKGVNQRKTKRSM